MESDHVVNCSPRVQDGARVRGGDVVRLTVVWRPLKSWGFTGTKLARVYNFSSFAQSSSSLRRRERRTRMRWGTFLIPLPQMAALSPTSSKTFLVPICLRANSFTALTAVGARCAPDRKDGKTARSKCQPNCSLNKSPFNVKRYAGPHDIA